jgi:hypothetical protein
MNNHCIGYLWWHFRFYWPRLVASVFVRRSPKIQGFPDDRTSAIPLHRIRGINTLVPTHMCRVMAKHGSDKGQGWRSPIGPSVRHNYTTIYSVLFENLRDLPLRIFELGLGTNNANFISNMGTKGRPGASLRGWRELFPNALVYGADIDRDVLFNEDRIATFYCDQLDSVAIRDLWSQPALRECMDIIIDDGLHTFEGSISFLDGSLERLCPGGVYVIEDVPCETVEAWRNQIETVYSKRFPGYYFAIVTIPNSYNVYDNNLVIARRSR